MGIPKFFPYLLKNTEGIFRVKDPKTIVKIDNLYLDFNGIIHNAVKEVFFPPLKPKRFAPVHNSVKNIEPIKELSKEDKIKKVFKKITESIDNLVKLVEPKELLFISIDGTAVVSKQSQQRQRRYKSANLKTDEEIDLFDTNAITPGTKFMKQLSVYVESFLKKKESEYKIKIIYSGPETSGEGEHLCIDHIRNSNKDKSFMVYGLDADLFMITMSTHYDKIYLLREDQFCMDTHYYVVNVDTISNQLFKKYDNVNSKTQFIDDFIFLCFLVGNDFLHNLPAFYNLESSIELMLNTRKKLGDIPITNKNFSINMENLLIFFKEIAKMESDLLSSQIEEDRYENVVLNSSFKDLNKKELGIDLDKFRMGYYKKAKVEDVDSFCRRYIQGLDWVNFYYHNPPKNWQWLFPYHYSPLICDLVKFLEKNKTIKRMSQVKKSPLTPEQQLLCVIPPRSKNLLSKKLQEFYTHPELIEYFPETFELDYSGKLKEWEAVALLPFIDLKKLLKITNLK